MKIKSIRSKMLVSIMGITLLTALAMACVFYIRAAHMIEQNYVTLLQQKNRLLSDTMDDMLKSVCNITINASCDEELKGLLVSYLKDGDEKRLNEISSGMRSFAKQNSFIYSMYMMIPKKNQVVTTLDYPVYHKIADEKSMVEFQESVKLDSGPVILEDMIHDGEKLLVFAEKIENADGELLGYVCANIEERKLSYEYFDQSDQEEIDRICLVKDGKIIASDRLSQIGKEIDQDKSYGKWMKSRNSAGADKENIYVYCEGAFSGCGIFTLVKRNVILSDLMTMRKYIAGIVAGFLVLAFMAAVYFTRIVYRPVKKLTVAMQSVAEGDITTRAEVISQDEIGMAASEFNQMLDRIEELIARLIKEEQMKKDAELEALQYQITPHFMYNTLNSIKCYSLIKGEKELAGVIEDFVELLQTCISKKGTFLTVAEEVQILKNYIRLQEFRNGEQFETKFEIASEAEQCLVPRLILQPLVENAILHGMDVKKETGKLKISAWITEKVLYLQVKDNGRGMTKEQIKELLEKKVKKTKGLTAVGIPNVRDRLKLYYGEKAELSYQSTGDGTTAEIYLPAVRNGEISDEESIISR